MVPQHLRTTNLKVTLLLYEERARSEIFTQEICRRLESAGHRVVLSRRTLASMEMDLNKVKRYVSDHPSDVWIPVAASRDILEWMSAQPFATMALFGRRSEVDVAAVGPDKISAMRELTEKLIALGHKRIVLFSREERRHPSIGNVELTFLDVLKQHGIPSNRAYNLPDWTSSAEGFKAILDKLFGFAPPTAFIVEESQFFFSALQQIGKRGLSAPEDISIACTDDDLVFEMSSPRVTCIHWDLKPIVDHIVKWTKQVSKRKVSRFQKLTRSTIIEGGTIGRVTKRDQMHAALVEDDISDVTAHFKNKEA